MLGGTVGVEWGGVGWSGKLAEACTWPNKRRHLRPKLKVPARRNNRRSNKYNSPSPPPPKAKKENKLATVQQHQWGPTAPPAQTQGASPDEERGHEGDQLLGTSGVPTAKSPDRRARPRAAQHQRGSHCPKERETQGASPDGDRGTKQSKNKSTVAPLYFCARACMGARRTGDGSPALRAAPGIPVVNCTRGKYNPQRHGNELCSHRQLQVFEPRIAPRDPLG